MERSGGSAADLCIDFSFGTTDQAVCALDELRRRGVDARIAEEGSALIIDGVPQPRLIVPAVEAELAGTILRGWAARGSDEVLGVILALHRSSSKAGARGAAQPWPDGATLIYAPDTRPPLITPTGAAVLFVTLATFFLVMMWLCEPVVRRAHGPRFDGTVDFVLFIGAFVYGAVWGSYPARATAHCGRCGTIVLGRTRVCCPECGRWLADWWPWPRFLVLIIVCAYGSGVLFGWCNFLERYETAPPVPWFVHCAQRFAACCVAAVVGLLMGYRARRKRRAACTQHGRWPDSQTRRSAAR